MIPDDIPLHWRKLLDHVQKDDPKAILAGGCLRDTWDVYDSCYIRAKRIGESGLREYKGSMNSIRAVDEGKWNGEDVNVVECKPWPSPAEMLEEFDFGICQIAFDGKEIITTPAFHWDYKHGLFTMVHGRRYEKSKERFERINQRYGWKMAMSDRALVDAIKIKWKITQKKTEAA
jgi:hypothetical protein